jgi:hypothetical protein
MEFTIGADSGSRRGSDANDENQVEELKRQSLKEINKAAEVLKLNSVRQIKSQSLEFSPKRDSKQGILEHHVVREDESI